MNTLLDRIRSRGYWRVVIRPSRFIEKRIANISSLQDILWKNAVQLRGWDFPHADTRNNVHIDVDWISRDFEWKDYLEVWRLYQSGQFVDYAGLVMDWSDQSERGLNDSYCESKKRLNVVDVVFRFTEIFEFAARLSLSEAGDENMHIEVTLGGLSERALWVNPAVRKSFPMKKKVSINEIPYEVDLPRVKLMAEPRELALKPAIELFRRFDWDPHVEVLREMQTELRR